MDVRQYFDEQYYLKSYPEVSQLTISPFEHYMTIGWKEGKNPRADFDNNFYLRVNEAWHRRMHGLNPLEHAVKCKMEARPCYIHPNQLKKVEPLKNAKYYLALVAIFRDESRFLKEWIEFYKLMGVERFYLYNHLSQDNYMDILAPYIEDGTVELNHIHDRALYPMHWHKLQIGTYMEAMERLKDDVEWLIIVDTDEFMFPCKDVDLKTALSKYDDYASVCANWKLFGSSNIDRIASDKLLIETLTKTGESNNSEYDRWHVKCVVKPRYVEKMTQPHSVVLKSGYEQVNENYEHFYGPKSPYQSNNILTINHYWARDLDFFRSNKLSRVHLIHTLLTKEEKENLVNKLLQEDQDYSSVYDDLILRFVPQLRMRMFASATTNTNFK